MRFVSDFLSGRYGKSELCRIYGISRPTGDKWIARHESGEGFEDRSSAPTKPGTVTEAEVERKIVALRGKYPKWGARKLKNIFEGRFPNVKAPAVSTFHAILKRHGLTEATRKRRRSPPYTEPLAHAKEPNDVWSIDFKGDIHTGDGAALKPFTVSDAFSRYLLFCDVLPRNNREHVSPALNRLFSRFGAPRAIRSDNGPPFASLGIAGISRLGVELLEYGIRVERIEPGKPQQNGRHERMHWTLKLETASPPAATAQAQRARLKKFRRRFNNERPHEALGYRVPADVYEPSERKAKLLKFDYASDLDVRLVDSSGKFCWRNTKAKLGLAFARRNIGLYARDDGLADIFFLSHRIGVYDPTRRKVFNVSSGGDL